MEIINLIYEDDNLKLIPPNAPLLFEIDRHFNLFRKNYQRIGGDSRLLDSKFKSAEAAAEWKRQNFSRALGIIHSLFDENNFDENVLKILIPTLQIVIDDLMNYNLGEAFDYFNLMMRKIPILSYLLYVTLKNRQDGNPQMLRKLRQENPLIQELRAGDFERYFVQIPTNVGEKKKFYDETEKFAGYFIESLIHYRNDNVYKDNNDDEIKIPGKKLYSPNKDNFLITQCNT